MLLIAVLIRAAVGVGPSLSFPLTPPSMDGHCFGPFKRLEGGGWGGGLIPNEYNSYCDLQLL